MARPDEGAFHLDTGRLFPPRGRPRAARRWPEICRKLAVAQATIYRWKQRYAGMGVAEIRRLKQLEEENRRLKQLVADLTLDKAMLQDVLRRKW